MIRPSVARLLVAGLTMPSLVTGAWAAFWPAAFYGDFPGGRWIDCPPILRHLASGDVPRCLGRDASM